MPWPPFQPRTVRPARDSPNDSHGQHEATVRDCASIEPVDRSSYRAPVTARLNASACAQQPRANLGRAIDQRVERGLFGSETSESPSQGKAGQGYAGRSSAAPRRKALDYPIWAIHSGRKGGGCIFACASQLTPCSKPNPNQCSAPWILTARRL